MKFALLLMLAGAFLNSADLNTSMPSGFTVHEWGTFTSVAGEDGSAVEWDALGCKTDLPGFVNDLGYRGFKWRLRGTVRMETPVLYFYSSHTLEADVKVSFPRGLITEWYPQGEYQVYQQNPRDGSAKRLPANLNGLDTSLRSVTGGMEWKNIQVQPDTSPELPVECSPSRYYAARETNAAPLTVGGQHEKFLFYRGVGLPAVPLSARVSSDGSVVVENRGHDTVPGVILFENRGGLLGYRNAGAVDDVATLAPPSLDGSFASLRHDLEDMLVAQGLFPKEARAMVETWKDSWFEPGSRLIYIVPARGVDAILPLQVDPPAQTVRAFVGRIELITPEMRRLVEEAIVQGEWSTIESYDRFLEPILERVSSANPSMANQIAEFREKIQPAIHARHCR